MFLVINILGIFVFLGIGVLFSKRRNEIKWNSIKVLLLVNVLLAGFFIYLPVRRELVITVAGALTWLLEVSYSGISLVFGEWAKPVGSNVNFFMGVLLPLLLVVPLFDIMTYFGILPAIIRVLGNLMALITRQPKFEAFYAVEMVILGGIKSLAVSTLQLKRMKADDSERHFGCRTCGLYANAAA